jgi:hypothetical protein
VRGLFSRFANPLVLILLGAAAVSAFTGDVASFAIIGVVVALSVSLDFLQEYRAERAVEALQEQVAGAPISLPDRESIEVGKDRIHVLVGKGDLRHFLVLGHLALRELRLQLSWIKTGVDITHWRSLVERALANLFDGVTTRAVFLKDDLSSCLWLAGVGGVQSCRQIQKQSDAEPQSVRGETG